MTTGEFAEAVKAIVAPLGGSVTSFGRSPEHSLAIGSTKTSPHVAWLGMDVIYDYNVEGYRGPHTTRPNRPGSEGHQKYTKQTPISCKLCSTWNLKVLHEVDHEHFQPREWVALNV